MKKILIIGASSFIGNAFEKHILKVYEYCEKIKPREVMIIDKVHASNGDWKEVDYGQYDVVIILSAIVHRRESSELEELYYQINYTMPVEIAIKARQAGVKQLIFMSTAAVYGSTITHITKDTAANPDTIYGKSKLKAENKLIEMNTENFCVAIIRSPMVYGKGCKGNYVRLVKLATYNPIYPKIHNKRSMIHIDNLCKYMECIIENNWSGIFLPQDEQYTDTIMMIRKIRKEQGKRTFFIPGTAWIVRLAMKRVGSLRKMFGDWYYDREENILYGKFTNN